MGNSQSCCVYSSSHRRNRGSRSSHDGHHHHRGKRGASQEASHANATSAAAGAGAGAGAVTHNGGGHLDAGGGGGIDKRRDESIGNLQHISEREPDDWEEDPSLHPTTETMFMEKSKTSSYSRKRSQMHLAGNSPGAQLKKASSCSTIFIDDSTVSQPNLKNTIKCVALAIYYHIRNRTSDAILDIFDEKLHPLTVRCVVPHPLLLQYMFFVNANSFALQRDAVPAEYTKYNPEHRTIYRFIRTLFNAAQLTAECAIITLVYLERLLKYAEVDISPGSWKRITLGAILLASKVWDDQAVWNVDYCQILKDLTVEDM